MNDGERAQHARATIGVIGGSGFYQLFDSAEAVDVSTPYGEPSDVISIGTIGTRTVAFLPRHGSGHEFPAHRINYRANLWALRRLGVRQVLAPCAVGSLRPELGPGSVVVPDQVIDHTRGRFSSFYDRGAVHISFADPYCPIGSRAIVNAGVTINQDVTAGGTMIVIEGPRFSSRAESVWYASAGCSLVNMTGMPEAVLARELAMCYNNIALVTDLDVGITPEESVRQIDAFAVLEQNIIKMRELVAEVVRTLPVERTCPCASALDGLDPGIELPE